MVKTDVLGRSRGVLSADPASGQSRAGNPAAERYAGLVMVLGVPSGLCKWLGVKWGTLRVFLFPGAQMAGTWEWRKEYLGRGWRLRLSSLAVLYLQSQLVHHSMAGWYYLACS